MTFSSEVLILLRLLAAHLLVDFMMQPRSWIEQKKQKGVRAPQLYYHVLSVGLVTWLLLGDWPHAGLPLFIMVSHWAIDWWKSSRPGNTFYFVLDQVAHLLMILAGWLVYSGTETVTFDWLEGLLASPSFWIVAISYGIVIWPFGYVIGLVTRGWQEQISGDGYSGLEEAGMWIGRLERLLILTFILLQQYSAIGFLIAAKSVFRFSGKLEGSRERKEAEYILIGTLLSFALAILLGIGTQYLLG